MTFRWLLAIAIATSIICLFWIVVATDVAGALSAMRAGRPSAPATDYGDRLRAENMVSRTS
jgi:hypothetical protein